MHGLTGRGSTLAVHTLRGPIARPEAAAKADPKPRDSSFRHARPKHLACSAAHDALSLPVGDVGCTALVAAVAGFLSARHSLLRQTQSLCAK